LTLLLFLPLTASARQHHGAPKQGERDENAVYYTIIRHDTLWDISGKFLKDNFKWPYLWKLNPYIKNPDLIYPGDVVKIVPLAVEGGGGSFDVGSLPVVDLAEGEPEVVVLQPKAPPKPKEPEGPAFGNANMRKEGFITISEFKSTGVIMRSKDERLLLATGDEVFLSFRDRSKVHVGDRYTIFQKSGLVRHPVTGKKMGHMIEILGSLVVTRDSGVPEGRIDTAFAEVEAGASLMEYREAPREVRIRPSAAPIDGYVIASLAGNGNLAKGDILYIDRGREDGIGEGRLLKVLRDTGVERDPITRKKVELPAEEIGSIVVVEPGRHTSSCIVIKSIKSITAGDRVVAGDAL